MEERWVFTGSEEEIAEIIPISIVEEFKKGIDKYHDLFDGDEYIRIESKYQKSKIPGVLNLMIPQTNYFINIKRTSVTLLTYILDLTITHGAASTIMGVTGFNEQSIVRLNEGKAEKCVYVELCRQRGRLGNSKIYNGIAGHECVNNHMTCGYRSENKCTITEAVITDIFELLTEKNVLTKSYDSNYKCNI